ncbi:FkbM family methyltransferase [Caulobacter soli]|uniref:FkbM family methyltransferase n=1 Tax=Caulobacter soli TaxID=2708539 RepID=UPI0013E9EF08|nr:FkbM family methyltransferase [Caulobacter soli]
MRQFNLRPSAFVLTSTIHGAMLVNRHDYHLMEGGGYGVGHQLLETSAFDANEVELVLRLLEMRRTYFGDGVIALDCGANIGVHTIEWAQLMHGWGEVAAFEAQERVFYALAGNITLNNCFNARAIWAAVGEASGVINVPAPDYFKPSSFGSLEIRQTAESEFIGQKIDDARAQPTRMMAIDDLGLTRVDFIKIDIEGMEMEALRGARATITACKPQMLIEKIKTDEAALRAFLSEHGYGALEAGGNLLAIHETDPSKSLIAP